MRTVAFRLPGLVAHNYGDGNIMLFKDSKKNPFDITCVGTVSARKLIKKLKKFSKGK